MHYECTVLGLLDPSQHFGLESDGIMCETRKADLKVDLPLIDAELSEYSPNFQVIEDSWYRFWNSCHQ